MLVTIIIPVYNQKKYLNRCIKSVLEQSYSNLEIVLVDDGSNDGSEEICDMYAESDSRIRVIHKENGGLSSARNAALEDFNGDYVVFIDSDDYIPKNAIEKYVNAIKEHNAEIAILKMCFVAEDTNDEIELNNQEKDILMNSERAIEESLYQKKFTCCAPGKMYSKDVIKEIRFPFGKLSEDLAVCHKIFDRASRIVYTGEIGYYYRQQSASIMHIFNPRRLDTMQWCEEIELFCKEKYPQILNAAICRSFNVSIHLFLDLPEDALKSEICEKIWKEVKRTRYKVVFNKKARFRERAAALLTLMGKKVIRKVWGSKIAVRHKEM